MADANKTHAPTPRKLQKAREEGDLTHSEEVTSAVTLIALTSSTVLLGPWFMSWCKKELLEGLSCRAELFNDSQVFTTWLNGKIIEVLYITAPFLAILAVFGVISGLMVSGWNFTLKSLAFKPEALNPVAGINKLFSPESLVKLLLSVLKLALIGIIVYSYLRKKTNSLLTLQWADMDQMMSAMGGIILGVVIRICIGLLVIAATDWFYRKWKYIEKLKMSTEEVKEERRNSEGPPEIKSRLRRKQFELGMRRMLKKVPKASVVLVNPTHVAVALEYTPGQLAPVVTAKGADLMCEKIKEVARAYGVPIIRRPELAREIFATVKLDHPIPDKLYSAVAEVLAVLYRLKHAYAR
jgi:flagellar biosynthetic protein FlhB